METLKAGRELDLLMAEKVLGLIACDKWTLINLGSAEGPAFKKNCEHENCYPASEQDSALGQMGGCPQLSTSIEAAWKVVEHMRRKGFEFALDSKGGDPYWAEFATMDYSVGRQATGDCPALAICLAALQVFGI